MVRRVVTFALVVCALLPGRARADGPYEGQWREGPLSIRVDVQSWGGDCGARPASTASDGGGVFRVSQAGDQLTFHLRAQRTTRSCWSENTAVRRVSSSYQAGTWRIVCRTPPADARSEAGTYTIQAVGDDRLQFRDVSQYDWQLNESSCQATITTTQTFTRVGGASESPTEPTPREPVAAPEPRCTPGAATRVVLRPSSADVAPGGEQCFTARVVDAAGCAVRQRVDLAIAEGQGTLRGTCYVAGASESRARIVASAGALSDEATLSIHTMDLGDLIARRTESGSVGSGAPELDPTTTTAARVSARTEGEQPNLLLPALAVGGALVLVLFAALGLRRRGRVTSPPRGAPAGRAGPRARAEDPEAARPSDPDEARASVPPDDEPDHEPDADQAALSAEGSATEPEDRICPACRRGYPPTEERCAHDGTALVAYRDFLAGRGAGAPRKNVCPVCATEYPPTVTFCGTDGSPLVPREPADGA